MRFFGFFSVFLCFLLTKTLKGCEICEERRTIESKALFLPKGADEDAFTDDMLDQVLRIRSMDRFHAQIELVRHLSSIGRFTVRLFGVQV